MKPFIIYTEKNELDEVGYYIVQKAFPHYVGRVSLSALEHSIANVPIAGYTLYITFAGKIDGNFIPSYKDALIEIDVVFRNMAEFYLNEKINNNPSKYKKFKINAGISTE